MSNRDIRSFEELKAAQKELSREIESSRVNLASFKSSSRANLSLTAIETAVTVVRILKKAVTIFGRR